MNYLIYDCEIINMIPPKDGIRLDGYDYCSGWTDYSNMGISVVGVMPFGGDPQAIIPGGDYQHVDLVAFEEDAQSATVIGFNSKRFDDRLMGAHGIRVTTDYDILDEVLIAAGQYNRPYWKEGKSYSLGKIAEANGVAKTGTGELAPKLWQDQRFDDVVEYCLNDVKITNYILSLGLKGTLADPNTGTLLQLRPLPQK